MDRSRAETTGKKERAYKPHHWSSGSSPGLLDLQPLRQHVDDTPCILFLPEDDDYIIRVADQNCVAGESRGDLPHKPLVKHFMQVDVRQDW